jgi:hypothetical protein
MTKAAAIASSTAVPDRRATGPGPIATESSRPNVSCRTWLGAKVAGDGEMTGSRRPMLPRGPARTVPGTRTPGSAGTRPNGVAPPAVPPVPDGAVCARRPGEGEPRCQRVGVGGRVGDGDGEPVGKGGCVAIGVGEGGSVPMGDGDGDPVGVGDGDPVADGDGDPLGEGAGDLVGEGERVGVGDGGRALAAA